MYVTFCASCLPLPAASLAGTVRTDHPLLTPDAPWGDHTGCGRACCGLWASPVVTTGSLSDGEAQSVKGWNSVVTMT